MEMRKSPGSHSWLWLIALALTCASCASPARPSPAQATTTKVPAVAEGGRLTPTTAPQQETIRVLKTTPVVRVTRNDDYYFDNCSGTYTTTRSLSEAAQVRRSVRVAEQATTIGGSAAVVIPTDLREQIIRAVEVAYKPVCEAALSEVAQTTLLAEAHARYNIVIVWEERVYSGSVSFSLDGVAYTAEYTYTLEVPRAGTVKPGICTP